MPGLRGTEHGEAAGTGACRAQPDPELCRKVLKELEHHPGTKYAYVVDNPPTR